MILRVSSIHLSLLAQSYKKTMQNRTVQDQFLQSSAFIHDWEK